MPKKESTGGKLRFPNYVLRGSVADPVRVAITGASAFILGFSVFYYNYLLNEFIPISVTVGCIIIGFILPLLYFITGKSGRFIYGAFAGAVGIFFMLFLVGGIDTIPLLFLFIPTLLAANLSEPCGIECKTAHLFALISWIPAWMFPYSDLYGYYILYVIPIIFMVGSAASFAIPFKRPEPPIYGENGEKAYTGFRSIGILFPIYILFTLGLPAVIFKIFSEFSWIDPNPPIIGALRTIYARPYAPWDSVLLGAVVIGYLVICVNYLFGSGKGNMRGILKFIAVNFTVTVICWIAVWKLPFVPFFIFAVAGLGSYVGGILAFAYIFAHVLEDYFRKILGASESPLGKSNVIAGLAAFIICSVYIVGTSLGFALFGVIERNMYLIDYIPWVFPIFMLIGLISAIGGVYYAVKSGLLHTFYKKPLIEIKKIPAVAIITVLVFGSLYTVSVAKAHGINYRQYGIVYMWGTPPDGYFNESVCEKITHVSLGGVYFNRTTGEVYGININESLKDYYTSHGIKVLPVLGLTGESLWHLLNNTNGMLDRFLSTLRTALNNSDVDGLSVDFEELEVPTGATPPTQEDWLDLWKRMHNEVFHPSAGRSFIFANYYGIGAGNSPDFVNSYMSYVDIHINNFYESHWHGGAQGATTIAQNIGRAIFEIYNLLDNKSLMSKVVLGLPLYGYRWIWGEKPPIPFMEEYSDKYTTVYEKFEPYVVTMSYADNSIVRWDPFSGAEWFEYFDEKGRRCVAYTQGAEQLVTILNSVDLYGIGGVMFWPGGNIPYPHLFEIVG